MIENKPAKRDPKKNNNKGAMYSEQSAPSPNHAGRMAKGKQFITVTAEYKQSWPDTSCFLSAPLPLEQTSSFQQQIKRAQHYFQFHVILLGGTGSGPKEKKGDGEMWEVTEKGSGWRKENPSVTSLDIFKPSC